MSFEVPEDIFAMFQAASNCIFGLKLKTALHNRRGSVCVRGRGHSHHIIRESRNVQIKGVLFLESVWNEGMPRFHH